MSLPVVVSKAAKFESTAEAGQTTSPLPDQVAVSVVPDIDNPDPSVISSAAPAPADHRPRSLEAVVDVN